MESKPKVFCLKEGTLRSINDTGFLICTSAYPLELGEKLVIVFEDNSEHIGTICSEATKDEFIEENKKYGDYTPPRNYVYRVAFD